MTFTVSLDGRVDQVKMYDRPTEVKVEAEMEGAERRWRICKGAHLRISDETGKVILEWFLKKGEMHTGHFKGGLPLYSGRAGSAGGLRKSRTSFIYGFRGRNGDGCADV